MFLFVTFSLFKFLYNNLETSETDTKYTKLVNELHFYYPTIDKHFDILFNLHCRM